MSRRRLPPGFTLIEICIVLFLAMLMISVAVPSMTGQLARRRLQEASDRLDTLVTRAREASVKDGKAYQLVWEDGGSICLYPADASEKKRRTAGPMSALKPSAPSEHYTLVRDAALTAQPAAVWTFWPTGNCEAVKVHYEGRSGEWDTSYNPLSGLGTFTRFIAR